MIVENQPNNELYFLAVLKNLFIEMKISNQSKKITSYFYVLLLKLGTEIFKVDLIEIRLLISFEMTLPGSTWDPGSNDQYPKTSEIKNAIYFQVLIYRLELACSMEVCSYRILLQHIIKMMVALYLIWFNCSWAIPGFLMNIL